MTSLLLKIFGAKISITCHNTLITSWLCHLWWLQGKKLGWITQKMILGVKMSGQSHSHFYFLIKYTYWKKDPNLTGFWTILPKNVDFSKSFADKAWYLYIFWKNIRGGNFIQKISFWVKLFWELGWERVIFTLPHPLPKFST